MDVYFRREDKALKVPDIDLDAPKGKRWNETSFNKQFPALASHYGLAD